MARRYRSSAALCSRLLSQAERLEDRTRTIVQHNRDVANSIRLLRDAERRLSEWEERWANRWRPTGG